MDFVCLDFFFAIEFLRSKRTRPIVCRCQYRLKSFSFIIILHYITSVISSALHWYRMFFDRWSEPSFFVVCHGKKKKNTHTRVNLIKAKGRNTQDISRSFWRLSICFVCCLCLFYFIRYSFSNWSITLSLTRCVDRWVNHWCRSRWRVGRRKSLCAFPT